MGKSCWDCIHCDVCANIDGFSHHVSDVSKCKHFKGKADVEPVKHSFWKNSNLYFPNLAECDVCGYEHYDTDEFKYCPNCGARMDGEDVQNERV